MVYNGLMNGLVGKGTNLQIMTYFASNPDLIQKYKARGGTYELTPGLKEMDYLKLRSFIYTNSNGGQNVKVIPEMFTFDAQAYMAANPDVAIAVGGDELKATMHYVQTGFFEGRLTQPAAPVGPTPAEIEADQTRVMASSEVDFTADINGDSISEQVFFDTASRTVKARNADGTISTIGPAVSAGWSPFDVAKVFSDGSSAIMWRNSDGQVVLWRVRDGQLIEGTQLPNVGPEWSYRGSADLDGDGLDEILWQNKETGWPVYWKLDPTNGSYSGGVGLPISDPNWVISGTGDFNNDGRQDIVWRNTVSSAVVVWQMNSNAQIEKNITLNSVNNDWKYAGSGDLDGDGDEDMVWRNIVDGSVVTWANDAGAFTGKRVGEIPLEWQVSGVGDIDGDGRAEVSWKNTANQTSGYWVFDSSGNVSGTAVF
ncbi:MAG: FG-GAP repeat domain-containing protein [Bosea sp. (in: a-proteobacteria)]